MILAFFLLLTDIFSKRLVVIFLKGKLGALVVPNIFQLIYVENRGAAFGIFYGARVFLSLVSLGATIFLIYLLVKKEYHSKLQQIGYSFLLAGATGNLLDRVFLGYVVDFLDFPYFPTFNFADIFVNIGVFLLVIVLLKDEQL